MELFVGYLLFLITFFIGYFLGQGKITKESVVGAIQQAVVITKKKLDT